MQTVSALPDIVTGGSGESDVDHLLAELDRIEESARQARCLSWPDDLFPELGRFYPWCRNGMCPRCGQIRAPRRWANLARQVAQHPGRALSFMLSALPADAAGHLDQAALRKDVRSFTRRLRAQLPGLEYAYRAERNPAGTGFHLHAVGWSDRQLSSITQDDLIVMVSAAWGQHAHAQQLATGQYRHQTTAEAAWGAAKYLQTDYRDEDKREDSWELNNGQLFHGTRGVDMSGEIPPRGLFDYSMDDDRPGPTGDGVDDLTARALSGGPEITDEEWQDAWEARRSKLAADEAEALLVLKERDWNIPSDEPSHPSEPPSKPPEPDGWAELDPELRVLLGEGMAPITTTSSTTTSTRETAETRQRRYRRNRRRDQLEGHHYDQGLPPPTERQHAAYDARLEAQRHTNTRGPRRDTYWDRW